MEQENVRKISQSNAITNARYDLSKLEKNALYKIIEKIRHEPCVERLCCPEHILLEFDSIIVAHGFVDS